jgi:xanthine dehydrogenase iron-sulfur cluster and FAD-binding subunit A
LSGERTVLLDNFFTGVRRTVMQPDEFLVDISFPALTSSQRGIFIKIGLRRAQAISLVSTAIVLTLEGQRVVRAVITLGSVAPTVIHATGAEEFLAGKYLDDETIEQASRLAMNAARPISDIRSPADYRSEMVRVSLSRGLRNLAQGQERLRFPSRPVLLWGQRPLSGGELGLQRLTTRPSPSSSQSPIVARINGKECSFTSGYHKTLLHLLREEAGLTGTKEGCGEGECGACTVFLDGVAVMSCLVPAPRAHGAEIVTVEGLARDGRLHPVQQAFIDQGAVQCGYCTPGFVMSAVKLLEEQPRPNRQQIQQAITGNLCRCTGYYAIVAAIERASQMEV